MLHRQWDRWGLIGEGPEGELGNGSQLGSREITPQSPEFCEGHVQYSLEADIC